MTEKNVSHFLAVYQMSLKTCDFEIYKNGKIYNKKAYDHDIIKLLSEIVNNCNKKIISQRGQKIFTLKCGYDTETTRITEIKKSFVYIHQFAIEDYQILFRTWEQFTFFFKLLNSLIRDKNKGKKTHTNIIIWVANLSYEFQFFRKHLQINEVFARTERQPLKVVCDFLEFRDCLAVSGQGGLKQLAKTYCKTQKLSGDLDYSIIRNYYTELSETEIQYCLNDVIILTEFAEYIFKTYKCLHYIPLTQTGIVRKDVKRTFGDKYKSHKEYIAKCYPKENTYKYFMENVFRGGYVHSNIKFTNAIIENVNCVDFTSSYPAVMCQCYYPISKYEKIDINKFSDFESDYCYIVQVTFSNLENLLGHSIESAHKVIEYNPLKTVIDNGRIFSTSDKITVALTELDIIIYSKFYQWKNYTIDLCLRSKKGFLPKSLIDNLNKEYSKKCELKRKKLDDTIDYKISKSKVNSHYGMCVTRLNFSDIIYNGETWNKVKSDKTYSDLIKSEFLLPQWGIYITAWARYNLLITVSKMENVIYCDTDSIYYKDSRRNQKIINEYNSKILEKNKILFGDNFDFYSLGQFSNDGFYKYFKTLGCKRYVCFYEKNGELKVKQTISGVKKNALENLMNDKKLSPVELLNLFDDGLEINNKYCEKLTSAYCDETYTNIITDYQGNKCKMTELSGIALMPSNFNIKIGKLYKEFYKQSLIKSIRPENENSDLIEKIISQI